MDHEWGNYPENFIPKMYWGARAILERVSGQPGKVLCLLPDRQSFERLDGSRRSQDAFIDWINEKVLPELRRLSRENRFYEARTSSTSAVVMWRKPNICFVTATGSIHPLRWTS